MRKVEYLEDLASRRKFIRASRCRRRRCAVCGGDAFSWVLTEEGRSICPLCYVTKGQGPICSGKSVWSEEGLGMNPEPMPVVLVVDDNREHCQALAKSFERAGYRVSTAAGGQEALRTFMQQPFDLIVTDVRMPHMNGLDLLRYIRAMSPQVAVLMITAFGEWTTYMQAMDSGCTDYLNKPVRREDLLMAARKALARRGIRTPPVSTTP